MKRLCTKINLLNFLPDSDSRVGRIKTKDAIDKASAKSEAALELYFSLCY
jgi:hypothetical protein